jgi:hypothetical protein
MAGQPSRRNSNQTTAEQVVVEAIFKAIWQIVSFPFRGRGGGKAKLGEAERAKIGRHWEEVAWYAEQPQYQQQAVMEADKLFDHVLQGMGVRGNTLGERLKSAELLFTSEMYNNLWEAHKLRNRLAHEVGHGISGHEAERAVRAFHAALVHLKVIDN